MEHHPQRTGNRIYIAAQTGYLFDSSADLSDNKTEKGAFWQRIGPGDVVRGNKSRLKKGAIACSFSRITGVPDKISPNFFAGRIDDFLHGAYHIP
jgi:hypothetical protein